MAMMMGIHPQAENENFRPKYIIDVDRGGFHITLYGSGQHVCVVHNTDEMRLFNHYYLYVLGGDYKMETLDVLAKWWVEGSDQDKDLFKMSCILNGTWK